MRSRARYATCFQRDRDRIIHCKSFRRLKYKTQVLLLPEGDHYRTRLTHTLEVSQIARTISRALRLNEGFDGGDSAGPRPRPYAVRPHGRARAGQARARERPAGLPSRGAEPARRGLSRKGRTRAESHVGGAHGHPPAFQGAGRRAFRLRPDESVEQWRRGWCAFRTLSPI